MEEQSNENVEQFCLLCIACSGFESHYWNQNKCGVCGHLLNDHKWRKPRKDTTDDANFECRVILYNDEIHSFDDVHKQVQIALQCTDEKAEDLVLQAHYGGACIYCGKYEDCTSILDKLKEIGLDAEVEFVHPPSDEFNHLKTLVLFHSESDSDASLGTILDKIKESINCSIDKAKYLLCTAASEGKVNLLWNRYEECILVQRILRPLRTEIRECDGSPLRLYDRCLHTIANNLQGMKSHGELTSYVQSCVNLPEDLVSHLISIAFKNDTLSFGEMSVFTSVINNITEVNIGAYQYSHLKYLPVVNEKWLSELLNWKHLRKINIARASVTGMDIVQLKQLPELKFLILDGLQLQNQDVEIISNNFHSLQNLSLVHCEGIDDRSIQSLAKMKSLSRIDLSHSSISSRGVKRLKSELSQAEVEGKQNPKKPETGMSALLQMAYERAKDRLPNNREIDYEEIQSLIVGELQSMIQERYATIPDEEFDEDEDEEDDISEEETENSNSEDRGSDSHSDDLD